MKNCCWHKKEWSEMEKNGRIKEFINRKCEQSNRIIA